MIPTDPRDRYEVWFYRWPGNPGYLAATCDSIEEADAYGAANVPAGWRVAIYPIQE